MNRLCSYSNPCCIDWSSTSLPADYHRLLWFSLSDFSALLCPQVSIRFRGLFLNCRYVLHKLLLQVFEWLSMWSEPSCLIRAQKNPWDLWLLLLMPSLAEFLAFQSHSLSLPEQSLLSHFGASVEVRKSSQEHLVYITISEELYFSSPCSPG